MWPFENNDEWPQLIFFENKKEFTNHLNKLNDDQIYNDTLAKQCYIVKKYFNKNWLRKYIHKYIDDI